MLIILICKKLHYVPAAMGGWRQYISSGRIPAGGAAVAWWGRGARSGGMPGTNIWP